MYAVEADENFASTYGLTLAQGRFFSDDRQTDRNEGVVINQAAARIMGMDQPVGHTLRFDGEHRIIGVLEDFHFRSLHYQIEPLVVFGKLDRPRYLAVRLHDGDLAGALASVHRVWSELIPGEIFECEYLDEILVQRYANERSAGTLIVWFAGTAIIVACLGLLGLSAYMTQRRVREIGIRKILGASESGVVRMLCGEYALLVLLAASIASPLAYFASRAWLDNFVYRASLGPAVFVIALAVSAVVTAASVLWPAIRAARANPVEALRYE
jgi:putative ABC transport system permease protein